MMRRMKNRPQRQDAPSSPAARAASAARSRERSPAAGRRVAVVGREQARADAVAAELGDRARGFRRATWRRAIGRRRSSGGEKAFGAIDILVNNAGLTRDNILFRLKDDDWDAVLDANLRARSSRRARHRGHDEAPVGADHQHRERRRARRQQGPGELRGEQGGTDRTHEVGGQGARAANMLVNCVAPGLHRDRHDGRHDR